MTLKKNTIGSYDNEPTTIALMHKYIKSNDYKLNITNTRYHHEIYLSNPTKYEASKLKTDMRYPIFKCK